MATDMQVYGVNVKHQSPWGVLGMSIITLGIYVFFWIHRVNREMRDFGKAYGDPQLAQISPGLSVVAAIIPIANLVGLHRIGTRIQRVQTLTGRGQDYSMGLHWILAIFTGLWFMYSQHALTSLYTWLESGNRAPVAPQAPALPVAPVGASAPGGPFVG
ncbi:MAG: hypothetical protein JWM86_2738 [Thermoleophilia bacterium]|nr:hypothetical protein [Thermoleophilia bacterium]